MLMRLALGPKAVEVEEAEVGEAGVDRDAVEEVEVVDGVPGKRHLDIDIIESYYNFVQQTNIRGSGSFTQIPRIERKGR